MHDIFPTMGVVDKCDILSLFVDRFSHVFDVLKNDTGFQKFVNFWCTMPVINKQTDKQTKKNK